MSNLLLGRAYRSEKLLFEMGDELTSPALNIERRHMFSFNQVAETVAWQNQLVHSLQSA